MDDAWYTTFVPTVATNQDTANHKRRASLLQQPNVSQHTLSVYHFTTGQRRWSWCDSCLVYLLICLAIGVTKD